MHTHAQKIDRSATSGDMVLTVDLSHSLQALKARHASGEKDFEQLSRWFEIALNNMGRGLSMFDAEQRLIVCNKRYQELFGLPEALTRPGTPFADIIRHHVKSETGSDCPQAIENERKWIASHVAEMRLGKSFSSTRHLKDGRIILVSNQPLPDGGWVDLQEDITEKCQAENKISWLARHDTLTELANRFHFREQLQDTLQLLKAGASFALHWIDLDHFKEVNDTFGHPVGDALLKNVAKRLRGVVRQPDIVARLGGDEFAIIQRGITVPAQASRLASRIVKSISEPHYILGHDVSIGASVGVTLAPRDGENADELIKRADIALYQAKEAGRGTFHLFEASQGHESRRGPSLQDDLRNALDRGELELYFQPIIDLKTRTTTSFEALLRWRHPMLGMIPPSDFIPMAEENGLIVPLGAWVLNEACKQAANWIKDVRVTVNLSPLQFEQGDLHQTIAEALARSGLPARRLELEITEGLLLRDDYATNEMLHKLRSLGVSISLDDFGTAYASLSYLRSFPFDKIKIDRTFMRDLTHPEREDCVAIINAVAGLARQLQMRSVAEGVVAEGVETVEHVNTAVVAGCDEVQGFYFSKPIPADQVDTLLTRDLPALIESEKSP